MAKDYDAVVRYQGGNNAGHTVVVSDNEYKFHLIPSGILAGKKSVLGSGMVINPEVLLKEFDGLRQRGMEVTPENLIISEKAHVIMPHNIRMDTIRERAKGKKRIGTTGRGIGPAYESKVARDGIRIKDLYDPAFPGILKEIMNRNRRVALFVYHQRLGLRYKDVLEKYMRYAEELRSFVGDSFSEIHTLRKEGRSILLEGAQGTMLDVDHGTYPYVTSTNTTAGGACTGSGLGPKHIDNIVGVVKAYTTRVGEGPFPTELGINGDKRFKIESKKDAELYTREDMVRMLNSDDPYEKGLGLRLLNKEYGTTTGRPRRTGWLDAVVLLYSADLNSIDSLALTRLDGLGGMEELRIAKAYDIDGKETREMPSDLSDVKPVYEELDGFEYLEPDMLIGLASKGYNNLPQNMRRYVETIEDFTGIPVGLISLGPGREHKVVRSGFLD